MRPFANFMLAVFCSSINAVSVLVLDDLVLAGYVKVQIIRPSVRLSFPAEALQFCGLCFIGNIQVLAPYKKQSKLTMFCRQAS